MYLKQDLIGHVSRKTYGKKGDKVDLIKVEGHLSLIRLKNLTRHYILSELLSEAVVKPDPETPFTNIKKQRRK